MTRVPVFAVVGHPNEGKSSVVATLVENESIRISPRPGETVAATSYPVTIDGKEVIVFVDTPGFQNPVQTLGWMRKAKASEYAVVAAFVAEFADDPAMAHECAILSSLLDGAGIIYVVDASRPLRRVDVAEMEILRLTGRPRMAILNCKTGEEGFLDEWKAELRRHFHMVRVFNAVRASFAERLRLLESLRALEQDWEAPLDRVVAAFVEEWKRRNRECAALAVDFVRRALSMTEAAPLAPNARAQQEAELSKRLEARLREEERRVHDAVCLLFRHDRRSFALPEHSVLREDLFSAATWTIFGLRKKAIVTAAMAAGGAAGAAVDLATLGHSLGLFAAVGGAAAGLAAFFQGERLAQIRVMGLGIGRRTVQVGPLRALQWGFILLDRFLLHYWYVIHWSHAVRDADFLPRAPGPDAKLGLSSTWDPAIRNQWADFFQRVRTGDAERALAMETQLRALLEAELNGMAHR